MNTAIDAARGEMKIMKGRGILPGIFVLIFASILCLCLDPSRETQAGVAGTNNVAQT